MTYDNTELITRIYAEALIFNIKANLRALKSSTRMEDGMIDFKVGNLLERDHQLVKSYIDGTVNPQQILPTLKGKLVDALRFLSRHGPRQQFQGLLGRIEQEITDEVVIAAFEIVKPELEQLIAEYEAARTQ